MNVWCKGAFLTLSICLAGEGFAELKPLYDDELSQYSGQAAVAFDVDQVGTDTFTRVTMGVEADIQMNIDTLEAGNYARAGETLAADLQMEKLGFGSISTDANQVQLDGNTYAVNDIVPFEMNDIYIELVQNDLDEVVGFRVGFGEARGQLSGDFNSISGNVGMEVQDFFGNTYDTQLLDDQGNADNVRSQHLGVANADSGNLTNCNLGAYCYDLASFKTLDVGERNETTGTTDYTSDFFLAFQKDSVEWQTSNGSVNAQSGAFINIPTSMQIDMNSGHNTSGTDRVRTEYINRGNDLF